MRLCGVWACGRWAVERLIHFNPCCIGQGYLDVCPRHLREHRAEHLLNHPPPERVA